MLAKSTNSHTLSIYFDGLCPICSKEIMLYKRKDPDNRLRLVDISLPSFSAVDEGVDENEVHEVFHVKTNNGQLIKGVDGFVKIWQTLEIFKPLESLATNRFSRVFFELGYYLFTKVRPYLRREDCEENRCKI